MTDIALLIKKYLKDELDANEKQELDSWIAQSTINRQLFEELTDENYLISAVGDAYRIDPDPVARQKMHVLIGVSPLSQEMAGVSAKAGMQTRSMWPRFFIAAAAIVLVVLSVIAINILRREGQPATGVVKTPDAEPYISPGTFKATLKLADGRSIVLDSVATGQLTHQGNTRVINNNGELVYSSTSEEGKQGGGILWNTLSTARGQTYPLLLSDKSRVWLNAESSIRFPVSFTGNKREVEITGEAFFEVDHDADKPFTVVVNGVHIQVLGTTFNVNAYRDENAVTTTLVEGSVAVTNGNQKKKIKPGQQALTLSNEIKLVENVDVDKITAWKKGYFRFKNDKLSEAMKNIARWYNIDVVYKGNAANIEISGNIHRRSNISEIIKLLDAIDVEAKIEGRELILKAQ